MILELLKRYELNTLLKRNEIINTIFEQINERIAINCPFLRRVDE